MREIIASRTLPAALLVAALGACFMPVSQAQTSLPDASPASALRLTSETPIADPAVAVSTVTGSELHDIAVDAYVYAYPAVLMEITRRQSTAVSQPADGRAPMNQFAHKSDFPTPATPDVNWPSTDNLYSSLWYDVSNQPLIVHVPASMGRYYMLTMLDMWTDVFSSRGTRTTGSGEQTFALVGPYWEGLLPPGIDVVRSPTSGGWMVGRVQAVGDADLAGAKQFQSSFTATRYRAPQSARTPAGRSRGDSDLPIPMLRDMSPPAAPAVDMQMSPADQVARMDANTFFTLFDRIIHDNPPHANDYPMLDRLRRIGIGGDSRPFSFSHLDPIVQQALVDAGPEAGRRVQEAVHHLGAELNGWHTVLNGIGTYGADYTRRAAVALVGLGANAPEDVIYPFTYSDDRGRALNAKEDYVLHFDKGNLPPVNAFWSMLLYNGRHTFAENPAHRYAIRSSDPLVYNPDGSLDIYVQKSSPRGDKRSNWLPSPAEGDFLLNMRLYWPKSIALDGQWAPPPVHER
jgi:hypothetical protein